MKTIIEEIKRKMIPVLTAEQLLQLDTVLCECLTKLEDKPQEAADLITLFLAAKRVEGCSDKTIRYYQSTIKNVLTSVNKDVLQITTDDLRLYLDEYQSKSHAAKTTIDNIRRILSSFFSWLEDDD